MIIRKARRQITGFECGTAKSKSLLKLDAFVDSLEKGNAQHTGLPSVLVGIYAKKCEEVYILININLQAAQSYSLSP